MCVYKKKKIFQYLNAASSIYTRVNSFLFSGYIFKYLYIFRIKLNSVFSNSVVWTKCARGFFFFFFPPDRCRLRLGSYGSSERVGVGTVQFRRPAAQGSRTRRHGQGRGTVVRGPRLSRRRLVASENKPESRERVRVLGRRGARQESLRGEINRLRIRIAYDINNRNAPPRRDCETETVNPRCRRRYITAVTRRFPLRRRRRRETRRTRKTINVSGRRSSQRKTDAYRVSSRFIRNNIH